ncbi:hypothetical protein BG011_001647 [Mortierella polycephala]|uniref:Fungal lipase-type domain-containing protein n=1 Tax=Mortierella polycephala TaxID=41804 RepID=A0A9P6U5M6_9FUNG|nr:hypothetical protein BG011_001647 [Mortierella polycephala]
MTWSVKCPPAFATGLEDSQPLLQQHRLRLIPERVPTRECHLREFCSSTSTTNNNGLPHDAASTSSTDSDSGHQSLKEPLSIKPMDFVNYLLDSIALYCRNLKDPSTIPGTSRQSQIYAMGILPVLIGILVFVQWIITLVVVLSSYTTLGRKAFQLFLKDQILLFDTADTIDPHGMDEALRQFSDTRPPTAEEAKPQSMFSYYLANLFLVLSTLTYERDDNLVKAASIILRNIESVEEKNRAVQLLFASEQTIDAKATQLGMRFTGVSELKSLGGPFAGLFYNDEAIVLVFKGTSVLAFNEYLIDATIQRVDAAEYLYGEVHKGFYESLFPDPPPLDCYEQRTLDKTNPFNTIMESIFETAAAIKAKTGKPVNFWMTGHSLGGALAALTMARLQRPLRVEDPLFKGYEPRTIKTRNKDGTPRTVLQEMLSRFSATPSDTTDSHSNVAKTVAKEGMGATAYTSPAFKFPFSFLYRNEDKHTADGAKAENKKQHENRTVNKNDAESDLLILRDCYSFASPKLGDTGFAQEFDRHHVQFHQRSAHKPMYYRVITDMDIVPRLPPGCSTNPDDLQDSDSEDTEAEDDGEDGKSIWGKLLGKGKKSKRRMKECMFPCPDCATVRQNGSQQEYSQVPLKSSHPHQAPAISHNYGTIQPHTQSNMSPSSSSSSSSSRTQKRPSSLLDYRNVGLLVTLYNTPMKPMVKPSEFQTDLSSNVLRPNHELLDILHQVELALDYDPTNDTTAAATGTMATTTTTTTTTTAVAQTVVVESSSTSLATKTNASGKATTLSSTTKTTSTSRFCAQTQAKKMDLAQTRHALNQDSRLRVPCDAEKLLLTFPNVISHSPATYQRNLVEARFYFKSFPGPEIEAKINQKIKDRQCRKDDSSLEQQGRMT